VSEKTKGQPKYRVIEKETLLTNLIFHNFEGLHQNFINEKNVWSNALWSKNTKTTLVEQCLVENFFVKQHLVKQCFG
jgi:hypothetical protein